jgi:transposase
MRHGAEHRGDQSEMDTRFKKKSNRWKARNRIIARRRARLIARRDVALHALTNAIVRQASDLTVIKPDFSFVARSARGTRDDPGGAVKDTAAINRTIHEQAAGKAVAMLAYKSGELGIRCDVAVEDKHGSSVGQEASYATKIVRHSRKYLRQLETLNG